MNRFLSFLFFASSLLSACQPPATEFLDFEICDDGEDNDGDSLFDCDDDECTTVDPFCASDEQCDDNADNDFNGATDCDDDACSGTPLCMCTETQVILAAQLPVTFDGDSADGVSAINVFGCQKSEEQEGQPTDTLESFFHLSFPDSASVDIKIESLDGVDMVLQGDEACQESNSRSFCAPGGGLDTFVVDRFDVSRGPTLFYVGAREAGLTGRFRITFSEPQ